MNLVSLGSEKMAISFNDLEITINDMLYRNLTFIVRLLTYDELSRVNMINTDNSLINIVIEEDIYNLAVEQVVGIDEEIDVESMEAGIVSTISGIILNSSNFYFNDPLASVDKESTGSTIFNQMQLVVAKNYNIQFKDILSMPIDELVRKFSLYQTTYPNEALSFSNNQDA